MRAHSADRFEPLDRAADQQQLEAVLSGYGYAYGLVGTVEGDRFAVRSEAGLPGTGERVLEAVVPALLERSELLVVPDAREDERFRDTEMVTGSPSLVSFMASLIRTPDGTPAGLTVLADTQARGFTPTTIGQMHLGVGMLESQFADIREAVQAHAVQRALLPTAVSVPAGYQFDGCSILHGSITGAYFDWHQVDDAVGFGLTESSGSGVGAGMIAAAARSGLRTAALLDGAWRTDLAGAVAHVSHALADDLAEARARVGLLYGVLSPATGEIRFVNAGLEPPLVIRADAALPLPVAEYRAATSSGALGADDHHAWTAESLTLGVGDTLVAASSSAWAVLAAARGSGRTAGAVTDEVEAWARAHPEYSGVALIAITRTAA